VSDVLGIRVVADLHGETSKDRSAFGTADLLVLEEILPLALATELLAERVSLREVHLMHLREGNAQKGQKRNDGSHIT
ncbi:hypothetical protein PMAYCL1PPCAC_27585, partial [Pristionchus mayeri]